ncbi:MAG TPA: hypothetical protein VFS19_03520 [Planctomycetota bacterium]|nr:hypothetical protein [Planctomycetota bacterium]
MLTARPSLLNRYGGLGIHTFLSTIHDFPNPFKGVVFLSVGVIDSREFKGEGTAEQLCLRVEQEFPKITFFAGKIIFEREHRFQALLHNETAYALQKRLQWAGRMVVIVPAKVTWLPASCSEAPSWAPSFKLRS